MCDAVPAMRSLAPLLTICTLIYLLDGLVHSILGPQAPDIEASLAIGHAEMGKNQTALDELRILSFMAALLDG